LLTKGYNLKIPESWVKSAFNRCHGKLSNISDFDHIHLFNTLKDLLNGIKSSVTLSKAFFDFRWSFCSATLRFGLSHPGSHIGILLEQQEKRSNRSSIALLRNGRGTQICNEVSAGILFQTHIITVVQVSRLQTKTCASKKLHQV